MSYAVMPLSDYDAACDKVREKVGEKTILFEETDFGYLRSAIFTVEKTGQYLFSFEFSDPSKFDIYSLFYNVPEWEGETSPGIFEIVDNNNATAYLSAGQQYRIFISDHLGLTPKDILKATLSIDGEVVVDFVPSLTIKSGDLADKVDEVYEAGQKAATVTVDQAYNPESTNAQSGIAVAEAQNFKQLFDTVTVTQEAFDEAGKEGINVISIGDENIDLSLYDEILISLNVPNSSEINTSNSLLRCYFTPTNNYSTQDNNWFVYTQSEGLSVNCAMLPDRNNVFTIKGIWKENLFLYGEVIRNGWSFAYGYTGVITGWNSLHEDFKKSSKKYIHFGTTNNFKFPVGTTVNVYGR